jgi:hypothetical protein
MARNRVAQDFRSLPTRHERYRIPVQIPEKHFDPAKQGFLQCPHARMQFGRDNHNLERESGSRQMVRGRYRRIWSSRATTLVMKPCHRRRKGLSFCLLFRVSARMEEDFLVVRFGTKKGPKGKTRRSGCLRNDL